MTKRIFGVWSAIVLAILALVLLPQSVRAEESEPPAFFDTDVPMTPLMRSFNKEIGSTTAMFSPGRNRQMMTRSVCRILLMRAQRRMSMRRTISVMVTRCIQ